MTVSIIIPVLNSERYIRQCLQSVFRQEYPLDLYEVIVVDNGSTDATVRIAQEYPVRVFTGVAGNVSKVRNFGAGHARGDVLVFLDSDCAAPEGWLKTGMEALGRAGASAAGSWYSLPEDPTWVQETWDLQMRGKRAEGFSKWVPSGNLMIRREVFDSIGGFDEDLQTGEDTRICQKLADQGHRIYCGPKLAVRHEGEAATVRQFFQKQRWHGIGGVQRYVREFPGMIFDRTILFAGIVCLSLLGIGISLVFNVRWVMFWIAAVCVIPFALALRVMVETRQWKKFFPLMFLYGVYGFARMMPVLRARLWASEIALRIRKKRIST